jgi:hypothetical protein
MSSIIQEAERVNDGNTIINQATSRAIQGRDIIKGVHDYLVSMKSKYSGDTETITDLNSKNNDLITMCQNLVTYCQNW